MNFWTYLRSTLMPEARAMVARSDYPHSCPFCGCLHITARATEGNLDRFDCAQCRRSFWI